MFTYYIIEKALTFFDFIINICTDEDFNNIIEEKYICFNIIFNQLNLQLGLDNTTINHNILIDTLKKFLEKKILICYDLNYYHEEKLDNEFIEIIRNIYNFKLIIR